MSFKKARSGTSKAEWLEAARDALADGGISAVRVEVLARSLGIAKSGFYWHFTDRRNLLDQLLHFWRDESTNSVTRNPELLSLEPKVRLLRAAELIEELELGQYDLAFRQWAKQDPMAAKAVRKVNRVRLNFVRDALSALGFTADELEMRTMLWVCYHTWETTMFSELSRKRRRALIAKRTELITRK